MKVAALARVTYYPDLAPLAVSYWLRLFLFFLAWFSCRGCSAFWFIATIIGTSRRGCHICGRHRYKKRNVMWTVVKLLEPKAYLQFMCTLVFKARAHLYYGLFRLLKRAGNLRQSPLQPLPSTALYWLCNFKAEDVNVHVPSKLSRIMEDEEAVLLSQRRLLFSGFFFSFFRDSSSALLRLFFFWFVLDCFLALAGFFFICFLAGAVGFGRLSLESKRRGFINCRSCEALLYNSRIKALYG